LRYTTGPDVVNELLANLQSSGYIVLGPTNLDGVVLLSELHSADQLASGWVDVQSPGSYRATVSGNRVFSAANGPLSVKTYLHPGEIALGEVSHTDHDYITEARHPREKYAFFGIHPCDLAAVKVLDRALMFEGFEDPTYAALRKNAVFIVANCGRSGGTCFCASMGTGPQARDGYDIALTELPGRFILDATEESMPLLRGIDLRPATAEDLQGERSLMQEVAAGMRRRIEHSNPAARMYEGLESPVWGEVAQRCLACGNCTMVCPTCFCNTTKDVTDLNSGSVKKVRLWDSCLSRDFTYGAGGNPRRDRKARYRQFVMHKFAYWTDQFELYGCVGCGRCITWCPVGIDISETVNSVMGGNRDGGPVKEVARVG